MHHSERSVARCPAGIYYFLKWEPLPQPARPTTAAQPPLCAHDTPNLPSAMQTTAAVAAAAFTPAAADRPMDRYVVRPAGVLADILGAAEFREDELLLKLRELGLIT